MLIERLVINASPLITLFRSAQSEILPALCPKILVPDGVWQEVTAGGHDDVASSGLLQAQWAHRLEKEPVVPVVQAWDLGAGESAVLSYLHSHPDHVGVLDDSAARRCARALQRRVVGTGGLLVLAKRKGIIPSVAIALNRLKSAGLWLAPQVEKLLLEAAQEDGIQFGLDSKPE